MIIAVKSVNEVGNFFANIEPMDFSDMGLMEATHYCQEMINESWNDLKFSIMAEEYKYLYENGEEIIYEDADTEDPKAKTSIVQGAKDLGGKAISGLDGIRKRLIALAEKFVSMVMGLINKATTTIRAHAISVNSKVSGNIAMSAKQFKQAAAGYTWDVMVNKHCKYGFTVDPYTLGQQSSRMITSFDNDVDDIKSAQDVAKELTREITNEDHKYYTIDRVADVVYSGYKAVGKGILELKKNSDKVAKEAIKNAKSAKADNLAEMMERYRKAQKANINTISGMLTVFSIYSKECRNIVNSVKLSDKMVGAMEKDKDKKAQRYSDRMDKGDSRKDKSINTDLNGNPVVNKAKEVAGNAGRTVSGAAGKAKGAVTGGAGKIKKKLFKEKKARAAAEK